MAPSAYPADHRTGAVVQLRQGRTSAAAVGRQGPAHLDHGVQGPAGLDSLHGVQGLGPGGAGRVDGSPLYLYRAQEAESDRVGSSEGLGSAGTDAALELALGSAEVSEDLQGAGRLVGEGCLGEEEDPGGLVVSELSLAQVVLGPQQGGDGLLLSLRA